MDPPMYDINQDRSNNYGGINRRDRVTRATALSMITDLMLNEHMHPSETVDLFEDLENACQKDGVSLPELLAENMYTGGVPPLMWEIQRCNWRESPELMMFLAINTPRSKVPWMIRTACQAVGDNELLQLLRETIEPDILCHVTSSDFKFGVSVTVRDLANKLRPKETSWMSEGKRGDEKKSYVESSSISIEWLVEERAWALELKTDAVELTLLQGPPAIVTASLRVDLPDEGGHDLAQTCDIDFPRNTVLLPISRAGRNSLAIKPTWRPESWQDSVRGTRAPVSFHLKVSLKQILDTSGHPAEEEKSTKSTPEEDDDWVIEYDDGEPTVVEEGSSGWVLASWSGEDKDMDEHDEKH